MGEIAEYFIEREIKEHFNFSKPIYEERSLQDFCNKTKEGILLHKSKDGTVKTIRVDDTIRSKYPLMDNIHLINTINYILRNTKNGVTKLLFCEDYFGVEVWEEDISKSKIRKMLGLKHYKKEAKKRGLSWKRDKIVL